MSNQKPEVHHDTDEHIGAVEGDIRRKDAKAVDKMLREITGGGSYLCSNDLRVHVGLGAEEIAPELEIAWPSGEKTRLEQVAAAARNLAQLKRITADLQRNAMGLRTVPIRQAFRKVERVVRADLLAHLCEPVAGWRAGGGGGGNRAESAGDCRRGGMKEWRNEGRGETHRRHLLHSSIPSFLHSFIPSSTSKLLRAPQYWRQPPETHRGQAR